MNVEPVGELLRVTLSREEAEKLLRLNPLVLAEVKTKLTKALAPPSWPMPGGKPV